MTNVTWINLTRHHINVVKDDHSVESIPPSGMVARVESWQTEVDTINGIDLVKTEFGTVINVPQPKPATVYITSSLVAKALSNRTDIVAPNTHPESVITDHMGRKVAVRGFQVFYDTPRGPTPNPR